MGEDEFQLRVATPTYATRPMSLYKARQETSCLNRVFFPCWCATGFYLVWNRLFFSYWCFIVSCFPVGVSQISYFKILPCQPNKWPLVIKHMNLIDNHRMIITAKYGLHHSTCYEENAIIISLWDLSVVIATKQNRQITIILAIF